MKTAKRLFCFTPNKTSQDLLPKKDLKLACAANIFGSNANTCFLAVGPDKWFPPGNDGAEQLSHAASALILRCLT